MNGPRPPLPEKVAARPGVATAAAGFDGVPRSHEDLAARPIFAMLTTLNRDGAPQCTAVGYLVDEQGRFRIPMSGERQKYRNLRRDPRCALFLIDPDHWQRTLEVRGRATLAPDRDGAFFRDVHDAYGTSHLLPIPGVDYHVATIEPVRVVAQGPS